MANKMHKLNNWFLTEMSIHQMHTSNQKIDIYVHYCYINLYWKKYCHLNSFFAIQNRPFCYLLMKWTHKWKSDKTSFTMNVIEPIILIPSYFYLKWIEISNNFPFNLEWIKITIFQKIFAFILQYFCNSKTESWWFFDLNMFEQL